MLPTSRMTRRATRSGVNGRSSSGGTFMVHAPSGRRARDSHRPSSYRLPASPGQVSDLAPAEAIDDMVIDHADGLHKCVADGRADEGEAPAAQVLAHGIGVGVAGRDLL